MCYGSHDDKSHRLCINLNAKQYSALQEVSAVLGVSMCQFVRMYINTIAYANSSERSGCLANEKSDTLTY